MGEAKRKSRAREEILATEPRCIYCPGPPQTLEHMPSRGMLRGKLRPSGMEYAACEVCNSGTRGSDAVAAVIARLHPDNSESSWQAEEMRKLMSALDAYAPGVREELTQPEKAWSEWLPRPRSASTILKPCDGRDAGPRPDDQPTSGRRGLSMIAACGGRGSGADRAEPTLFHLQKERQFCVGTLRSSGTAGLACSMEIRLSFAALW